MSLESHLRVLQAVSGNSTAKHQEPEHLAMLTSPSRTLGIFLNDSLCSGSVSTGAPVTSVRRRANDVRRDAVLGRVAIVIEMYHGVAQLPLGWQSSSILRMVGVLKVRSRKDRRKKKVESGSVERGRRWYRADAEVAPARDEKCREYNQ